jgi:hypothetical protein
MAAVTMMRCINAHWQGHEFVPAGALIPSDDPRVIPEFFAAVVVEAEKPAPKKRAPRKTAAQK